MREVQVWQKSFPSSVTESERLLVRDAHLFFTDLHSMNSQIRTHIQQCVLDMSRGMLHFLKNHRNNKFLILNSAIETNQYCFFVAGIVGELLTLIMSECTEDFTVNDDILADAFHFGLYLQKINLLKDYQDDRDAQRFFFKDFDSQISSAKIHGAHSLNYIRAIPLHAKQYRLFCAWSLFLGLASLKWVELSFQTKKKKKIPRSEALKVFARVRTIINSNELLYAEFIKYAGPINPTKRAVVLDQVSNNLWLQKIYSGKLSSKYFAELGLASQSRLR